MPLEEMPNQIRYKMEDNAPVVFLFPNDQGVVKEPPKGGCPFGFTSGDKPKEQLKWPNAPEGNNEL